MTPKELLKYLVEDGKLQMYTFQSFSDEDLNKARQRALDAISHYKEMKKNLSEREDRKDLYNQCLELIEKL